MIVEGLGGGLPSERLARSAVEGGPNGRELIEGVAAEVGAPFTARELAKAILGEPDALPEAFIPERSPISHLDRERAITAGVNATIGGEIMHGMELPSYRREEWAARTRTKIGRVYDARGLDTFGIHPEMIHFYEYDTFYEQNVARFL